MAQFQIAYAVPVEVVVEIPEGANGRLALDQAFVTRVVVIDEDVELNPAQEIHDDHYNEITDQATRDAVRAAAEDPHAMWPAWEFGF